MIGELLLAIGVFLWLLVFLIYLAMRVYIALRKAILNRKFEALMKRYEDGRRHDFQPIQYSAPIEVTRTEVIEEEEPAGDVVLELDLTKKD